MKCFGDKIGLVYLAGFAAAMNITVLGITSAYTSSISKSLKNPRNGIEVTDDEITWIASIIQMTAIPGALLSGYLSQKLGRKGVLIYNSLPFMASWLIIAYAQSVYWIYAGRFLSGCCIGIVTATVPTYLTEISTPENRGRLGCFVAIAFAIGILMAMSLGLILTWRWLAMVGAITMTITVVIMSFVPESPYWLIANSHKSEGYEALKFLRGKTTRVVSDYETIINSQTDHNPSFQFVEFLQPMLYKPIAISIALVFFAQFSGIGGLISYTEEIFSHAGDFIDSSYATLIVGAMQVPINFASSIIIDKAGRRTFYIVSGIFICIGLITIGLFILLANRSSFTSNFGWMPIVGYIIFFIGLAIGYGPLPYIMATEMTPLHARSTVAGLATVCTSVFSFIVTKTFIDLQTIFNNFGVYFFYAAISFIGIIFGWIFLPETKGKPLEEIQKLFVKEQVKSTELECATN